MMIKKYRKKPVVIEAIQWTGNNNEKINNFCSDLIGESPDESGIAYNNPEGHVIIQTLEGKLSASIGDYIVKGVEGEFYPVKPDIFEKTYELVEEGGGD